MTSPERGCGVRQTHCTLEFMRKSPFANSWAKVNLLTSVWHGLPICAHLRSLWSFVEISSQLCSDSQLFSAVIHAGVGSSFRLSSPRRELGIGWALWEQWGAGEVLCVVHGGRRSAQGPLWARAGSRNMLLLSLGVEVHLWPLPRDCFLLSSCS